MTEINWTSAEDAVLRMMRDAGATQKEIASALGKTFASVQGRIRYLGLPPKGQQRSEQAHVCGEKCKSCRYGATAGAVLICDYIGINGHTRGCPVGEDCIRYVKGQKARSKAQKAVFA